jgi:hypothetical protein
MKKRKWNLCSTRYDDEESIDDGIDQELLDFLKELEGESNA